MASRRDVCLSEKNEQMDVQEAVLLEELATWRVSVGSGCWKWTWREYLPYKYLDMRASSSWWPEMILIYSDPMKILRLSNSTSRNGADMESLYFLPNSAEENCFENVLFLAGTVSLPHQTPYHTPTKFIIGCWWIPLRNRAHSERWNLEVHLDHPPAFSKLNGLDPAQHQLY